MKLVILRDLLSSLSVLEKLFFPILNLVGQRQSYLLVVTTPDSRELVLLWGLIVYREGASYRLSVTCTASALRVLEKAVSRQHLVFRSREVR